MIVTEDTETVVRRYEVPVTITRMRTAIDLLRFNAWTLPAIDLEYRQEKHGDNDVLPDKSLIVAVKTEPQFGKNTKGTLILILPERPNAILNVIVVSIVKKKVNQYKTVWIITFKPSIHHAA